jgi:predicted PurR-regulated permease PerM
MDSSARNTVDAVWEIIKRLAKWTLILAGIVLAGYALYRIRTVVMSVFAAVLVTYILLPGVEWLCRKRNSRLQPKTQRLFATILVFAVALSVFAAAVSLFVAPFTTELSDFVRSFGGYQKTFVGFLHSAWKAVPAEGKDIVRAIDYGRLSAWIKDYVEGLLRIATSSIRVILELILIPVLAFYFVFDYRSITCELYGFIPRNKRREAVRIGRMAGEMLQNYIFGQLILCVIAGVLTGVFLSLLDIKYVIVLALFAGLTRAIPIIGPIVSGIPIVLVGALTSPGRIEVPLYLALFVTAMHFMESKFIMPHLIGRRLHLHPAVVIIVLLIGAEFFGLIGMFLAAPVAAILRQLIRRYYILPRDGRGEPAAATIH